jgi:hypothetical protein
MLWALRIVWITLPVTAGPAVSSTLHGWSDAPALVGEALVWLAWTVGLLTTVVARPWTLTVLRVVAPAFAIVAVLVAIDGTASTVAWVGALVATFVALALASTHDVALAAANAIAYGDEQRVLLRTPPALFLGPLPAARMTVAIAVAVPPLLLADERWVIGLLSLALAVPVVTVLARSLHGLSRRWGVLVPAGFVLVDPLTLSDPVLFLRERILAMRAVDAAPAPPEVLDLRLGAVSGTVALVFDEPAELGRRGKRGRGGEMASTIEIRVAVARRAKFLEAAGARRIHVAA